MTVPADDHDSALAKLETDHGLDEATCAYCDHPAPRFTGTTRSVLDLTVLRYHVTAGALVCVHGHCAERHRGAPRAGEPAVPPFLHTAPRP